MITGLSSEIRYALLLVLIVLTAWYSKRGLQNGVVLLLATSLLPMPQAMLLWEVGLPILTPERVVWPLVLLMFLFKWKQGKVKRYAPDLIEYCMVALLATILASMYIHGRFVSTQPDSDTTEKLSFYAVLAGFAIPFMCYFILRRALFTEAQVESFLIGVGAITLYLGITAIGEASSQSWLVFPKYILDSEVGIHAASGRVRGPFVQASWNGLAMVMGLPVLFLLFSYLRDAKRWLWMLGIASVALSLPFVMQRAVWLGAAATLSLTAVTWSKRGAMLLGGLLFAVTLGALMLPESVAKALASKMEAIDPIEYRVALLEHTWAMINQHTLIGVGFNNFEAIVSDNVVDSSFVSHNMLLTLFAELGLIGFLPYLLILMVFFFRSIGAYLRFSWCRSADRRNVGYNSRLYHNGTISRDADGTLS